MDRKNDSILREARRITKWNKRRLDRFVRRSGTQAVKGCQYKRTGFDPRTQTMS